MPPLNVKDALGYLDSVKARFRNEPEVYNDFLDIMKDFKTQYIDTPGVIDRVSSLFRGHPSLIQGFNTFLPPGYKIECAPDANDSDGNKAVILVTTPTGTSQLSSGMATNLTGINRNLPSAKHLKYPPTTQSPTSSSQSLTSSTSKLPVTSSAASSDVPSSAAVLRSLSNSAPVTTSESPAEPKAALRPPGEGEPVKQPTPEVAAHSNDPSPTKSKSTTPQASRGQASGRSSRYGSRATSPTSGTPRTAGMVTGNLQQPARSLAAQQQSTVTQEPATTQQQPATTQQQPATTQQQPATTQQQPATTQQQPAATQEPARPPVEFNHAISFVNRIKNRFTSDPDIYKTFLEILQTYQKEQRAIHDVYAQVTALFRDAPDLLDEFKQFLPDTSAPSGGVTGSDEEQTSKQNEEVMTVSNSNALGIGMLGRASAAQDESGGAPYSASKRKAQSISREDPLGTSQQSRPNKRNRKDASATDVSMEGAPATTGSTRGGSRSKNRKVTAAPATTAGDLPYPPPVSQPAISPPYPPPPGYPMPPETEGHYDLHGHAVPATDGYPYDSRRHAGAPPNAQGLAMDGPPTMRPYSLPGPSSSHIPPPPGVSGQQPLHGMPGTTGIAAGVKSTPEMSPEETKFFDNVSKFIDDRTTYHEFLKVLNLFTQDIIDLHQLVERVYLFIGPNGDLWSKFTEMVGWKDGLVDLGRKVVTDGKWVIENTPVPDSLIELSSTRKRLVEGPSSPKEVAIKESSARETLLPEQVLLNKDENGENMTMSNDYGPSYRLLPQSESDLPCSGRDALCWKVLNDKLVSQPTWSDEGFLVQEKNPYEQAMHRSEEERYEYDYYIEANTRTIALLEPIAARLAQMEHDKVNEFKLRHALANNQSSRPTMHHVIIKKIYGRRRGQEVLNALQETPAVVLPVILHRLKKKDEEWKRALKEWSRVWREADAKNYQKSLDPRGIEIKLSDKKNLNAKALVSEIEVIRRDQFQKRIRSRSHPTLSISYPDAVYNPESSQPQESPTYQLAYEVKDLQALLDSLKLILSFLDNNSSLSGSAQERSGHGSAAENDRNHNERGNYSDSDRDKIERFLWTFMGSFFHFRKEFLEQAVLPISDGTTALGGAADQDQNDLNTTEDGVVTDGQTAIGNTQRGRKRKEGVIVGPAGLVVIGGNGNIKRKPGRKPKNHPSYLEAALKVEKDPYEYQAHLRRLARKAGRDHLAILDRLDPPFDRRDELGQFVEDKLGKNHPEDLTDDKVDELCDAFVQDRSRKLQPSSFAGWAELDGFRTKAIGNSERIRKRFLDLVGHLPPTPPTILVDDGDEAEEDVEKSENKPSSLMKAHLAPTVSESVDPITSTATTPEPDGDATPPARSVTPTPAPNNNTTSVDPDEANTTEVAAREGSVKMQVDEVQAPDHDVEKEEVAATAGGLEAMEGVETVTTKQEPEDDQKEAVTQAQDKDSEMAGEAPGEAPGVAAPLQSQDETAEPLKDEKENDMNRPAVSATEGQIGSQRRYNFFCDTKFYCLLRLLQVLYSRVSGLREEAAKVAKFSSKQAYNQKKSSAYSTVKPTEYYDTLLELCQMVFANKMDSGQFEDAARAMFGLEAWKAYNLDKVVGSIVKNVHKILKHGKSDILEMLVKDRNTQTKYHPRQQLSYRAEAESIVVGTDEPSNFYRIEWQPGNTQEINKGESSEEPTDKYSGWSGRGKILFQLLGQDEIASEDEADMYEAWQEYMVSFVQSSGDSSEASNQGPWLQRNFRLLREEMNENETNKNTRSWSDLEARICMRSYKMFFVAGTEDTMINTSKGRTRQPSQDMVKKRRERWDKWLEKNVVSS